MEKVDIDEVYNAPNPLNVHDVRRPVSDVLGTDHFAMNYFELGPGDSFSGGLHTHLDQEEVFYVQEGTAVFDVGKDREEVTVEAGEVIRFEPGEFQVGYVPDDAEDDVVGWALGAPGASHEWDQMQSVIECRECGEERVHDTVMTEDLSFEFTCIECGNEFSL